MTKKSSPESKRLNISLIAKEAGVSVGTVSRFLNGSVSVKDETRKRISKIITKYNYHPNFMAQSLARGKSKTIGIVAMEVGNPCTSCSIQGILNRIIDTDYLLITGYGYANPNISFEEKITDLMVQIKVAGIIVLPDPEIDTVEFTNRLVHLSEAGIPVVLGGEREGNASLDCVSYDDKEAGYAATNHLIHNGFERVGIITGNLKSYQGKQRMAGYRQALIDANIKYNPEWVYEGHFRKEDGYQGLYHFYKSGTVPRALFCCNDTTALGALLAAQEIGLDVPKDLAIIGCDNIDLTRLVTPKLSTINFDNVKNGELIMDILLWRLQNPHDERKIIRLKPTIIERDSTRLG